VGAVPLRARNGAGEAGERGARMKRSIGGVAKALALAALLAATCGCGGGDDCGGFISINASPDECAALAMKFGCQSFEVDGPNCGLLACTTCGGLPTSTPSSTPTPTGSAA
jgi:hypothetical protein